MVPKEPSLSPRLNIRLNASLAAALIFLLISGLLSCNVDTDKNTSEVVVLGEDFANIYAMEELKAPLEKKLNTKIKFVKNTFDIFDQKAKEDLSQGLGRFGVILHYSSLLSLAAKGNVLTVPDMKALSSTKSYDFEELEKDLFDNVWRDSSYFPVDPSKEAIPIGYPFAANTMVLVYNKRMFDDPEARSRYQKAFGEPLGPPRTWKEFKQIAEFFTKSDGTSYGVVLQGAAGSPLYWEWCNFAFGHGGGVMKKKYGWQGTKNTPLALNDPKTIEGTSFYVSLKPYNAGDFFSTGQAEQQERMRTQNIAMAVMWSDSLYLLLKESEPGRFGFARIPGEVSMIGGGTYYINKNAPFKEQSAAYVLESMQTNSQIDLMKKGLCSARKSAYTDELKSQIPYLQAVFDSLQHGTYMLESGPESGLIRDVIEKKVQEIWRGKSVQEGLAQAQEEIERERSSYYQ